MTRTTQALAPARQGLCPAIPTKALREELDRAEWDLAGLLRFGVVSRVQDEARRQIEALDAVPRVSGEALRSWLVPLRAVLPWAPAPDVMEATLPFYARALADLPAGVLSEDAQDQALRELEKWPPPATLHKLLAEVARPWLRQMSLLRMIVRARAV